MECRLCGEIVHPPCADSTGHYRVMEQINDCWECPKCCKDEAVSSHRDNHQGRGGRGALPGHGADQRLLGVPQVL